VLWEHFDRILKSSNNMDTYLQELLVKSIDHFSLIYHRLIGSKLKIYVNGFEVIPSDPFLESNKSTQLKREQRIMIDNNVITVKPYILPHVNKLSTDDIKKVGGKESLRNNQGFYIYRNKRLIIWGTWFRLGNKEELFKLARVKVDVPNSLDYLWDIDIKKSKAVLPEKIKTNLYNAVLESCEISENVHIYKGKKVNNQNYQHMWNVIEKRKESLTLEINTDNPLVTKFVDTLDENQKKIFKFLINDIENNIPLDYIYSQIAKGKNSNQELSIDEKDIIVENIKNQLNNYENIGITRNELIGILMQQEQYAKDEYILSKLEELREDCNVSEY
jgi:hypothetical protein